jgi:hypothetical protein
VSDRHTKTPDYPKVILEKENKTWWAATMHEGIYTVGFARNEKRAIRDLERTIAYKQQNKTYFIDLSEQI